MTSLLPCVTNLNPREARTSVILPSRPPFPFPEEEESTIPDTWLPEVGQSVWLGSSA